MKQVARVLDALFLVCYPALLYFGVTHWGTRAVGWLVLGLWLPRALVRLASAPREHLRAVARVPLLIAAIAGASLLFDDPRYLLLTPTLIHTALLATFAASMRGPVPMVERFARLVDPDLTPAEVAWCRAVTVVWCVFFGFNAALSLGLALLAPLAWWALYTGAVAYALVGILFAVELVWRKYRFRRYGTGLGDRVFARLFPAREAPRDHAPV